VLVFLVDTSLTDHTKKETTNTIKNYTKLLKTYLTKCCTLYLLAHKSIKIFPKLTQASISQYHKQLSFYKLLNHNSIYTVEYIAIFEEVRVAI